MPRSSVTTNSTAMVPSKYISGLTASITRLVTTATPRLHNSDSASIVTTRRDPEQRGSSTVRSPPDPTTVAQRTQRALRWAVVRHNRVTHQRCQGVGGKGVGARWMSLLCDLSANPPTRNQAAPSALATQATGARPEVQAEAAVLVMPLRSVIPRVSARTSPPAATSGRDGRDDAARSFYKCQAALGGGPVSHNWRSKLNHRRKFISAAGEARAPHGAPSLPTLTRSLCLS